MQAAQELDTLVKARREWNDDATAMYRLDAISGWHWHGGIKAWETQGFVYTAVQ